MAVVGLPEKTKPLGLFLQSIVVRQQCAASTIHLSSLFAMVDKVFHCYHAHSLCIDFGGG